MNDYDALGYLWICLHPVYSSECVFGGESKILKSYWNDSLTHGNKENQIQIN